MKVIHIRNKDLGFFTQKEITVQRFASDIGADPDDKEMIWCNHAGAIEDEIEQGIVRVDKPDIVWVERILECDKCTAWKHENDDRWQDAPYEGIHFENI